MDKGIQCQVIQYTAKAVATGPERNHAAVEVKYDIPTSKTPTNWRALGKFLRAVLEPVEEQLQINILCRSERGRGVDWDEKQYNASLETVYKQDLYPDLRCLDVQLNANASSMAALFARRDHTSFCTHAGGIVIWRTRMIGRESKPYEPTTHIQMDCCPSCMAFNPSQQDRIIVSNIFGQILLYKLEGADCNLIGDSGLTSKRGHTENISSIHWTASESNSKFQSILTAGSDGRIISWSLDPAESTEDGNIKIVPKKYIVIELTAAAQVARAGHGITCVVIAGSGRQQRIIVGTEAGHIYSTTTESLRDIGQTERTVSPSFRYKGFSAPVTALAVSPFDINCFAATSTDGKLQIYDTKIRESIFEFSDWSTSYLTCQWSPHHPFILVVGASNGSILIFNVSDIPLKPLREIIPNQNGCVSALTFDKFSKEDVIIGCETSVKKWNLPNGLISTPGDEPDSFRQFWKTQVSSRF